MTEEAIVEEVATVDVAPESEAPAESVETEAAVTPTETQAEVPAEVEEDAPIPAWMTSVISRTKRKDQAEGFSGDYMASARAQQEAGI